MTAPIKEAIVALPGPASDIYRRHQMVWQFMHRKARSGSDFTFAMVADRMALVRSTCLPFGRPSAVSDGLITLDTVALVRNAFGEAPVPDVKAKAFAATLLGTHGFAVHALRVSRHRAETGLKQRCGRTFRISLPVRTIVADVRVADPRAAADAWLHGVGRGKRFGFGMLRHSVC
ncbi:MAG TPA: type I-E CRISPR-associated protein Cas6/Cse3/CasE [Nevskiaceae bacterium]|nr:type I-E CRISPR-associated protein Cas6/Cse3/CasE [Nevskiaceae bacterium]